VPSPGLEQVLLALFSLLTLLGLANAFSLIINSYDHNESLYLTAGWLMAHDHRLYVDFAFWQMPYSPLIYATVFKVFQPENHLLAGKLTSFAFLLLATGSLAGLVRQVGGKWWLALAVTAGMTLNTSVVRCAMEASNYIMPITFSFAGLWAGIAGTRSAHRQALKLGIAGVLFALAVGTKLYYLPAAFGMGVALLLVKRDGGWFAAGKELALPFTGGFVLGLLPIVPFILRDPELFFLNNLGAHGYTTAWWLETAARYRANNLEPGLRLTNAEKFTFTNNVLIEPANLALLVVLLIGAVMLVKASGSSCWRQPAVLISALAFLCAWPAAFAPTPMWYQYLGMPLSFAVIVLGALLALLPTAQARLVMMLAGGWVICSLYGTAPTLKENLSKLNRPKEWVAVGLPQIARELAAKTPANAGDKSRLLCLQQLMAIESGRWQPYPELAYAPFTYVIADRLPEPLRLRSHFLGPQELPTLLQEQPPAAVLAGLYDAGFWSDAALDQWSQQSRYRSVTNPYGLRLYLPAQPVP
jgi:MFS family permease